jgi:hypothetical protein
VGKSHVVDNAAELLFPDEPGGVLVLKVSYNFKQSLLFERTKSGQGLLARLILAVHNTMRYHVGNREIRSRSEHSPEGRRSQSV